MKNDQIYLQLSKAAKAQSSNRAPMAEGKKFLF